MKILVIFLALFISAESFAQENSSERLSLEECIDLALNNNINLKRSHLQTETAKYHFRQSKSEVLPSLNASYNYGLNNGRSVDPYTNDIIDQQLDFSNASLNFNGDLFKGFELRNKIQRDRYNLKASEAETEEARQQLILNVTLAYFQVLNARDLLELAQLRLKSTKEQTDRLKTLYDQGEGNPADYTDILGQVNSDQSSVLEAKKSLAQARLELAQLLNTKDELKIEDLAMLPELENYDLSAQEVYEQSLSNLATFKAGELRIKAAKEDVGVARALYSPQISLFAQLNTYFSSSAKLFNEIGTQVVPTGQFIKIDDVSYPVMANQSRFSEEKIGYKDQFENNLNSVVGVAVDIPIFNGFRARQNVQLKKIQLQDRKLEFENTKNEYFKAIREAYNDMEAAYQNYRIFMEQVDSYEKSYRVNEIRFKNGVSNMVEFIISKNNLDRSRINLANARYEYMIRVKVLDYYRGV